MLFLNELDKFLQVRNASVRSSTFVLRIFLRFPHVQGCGLS